MKLKIKVTKEILEESKNSGCKSRYCAIARAASCLFNWVSVGSSSMLVQNGDDPVRIDLPLVAVDFIRDFDRGSPDDRCQMAPIEFEIDVPEAVIETIGLSEVHRILKGSTTLELV